MTLSCVCTSIDAHVKIEYIGQKFLENVMVSLILRSYRNLGLGTCVFIHLQPLWDNDIFALGLAIVIYPHVLVLKHFCLIFWNYLSFLTTYHVRMVSPAPSDLLLFKSNVIDQQPFLLWNLTCILYWPIFKSFRAFVFFYCSRAERWTYISICTLYMHIYLYVACNLWICIWPQIDFKLAHPLLGTC